MINLNILLLFLVIFINFVIGLLVFIEQPKNKTNQSFVFLIILLIVWTIVYYFQSEPYFKHYAVTLLKLDFSFGILLCASFYLFSLIFPYPNDHFSRKKFILVPASILVILTFTNLIFKNPYFRDHVIDADPGSLFWLYFIFALFYIADGIRNLYVKYKKSTGIAKTQVLYVFLGLTVSAVIIFIINLVIATFFPIPLEISRMGIYSLLIFCILTAIAITRHHLFNIKVIATELFSFAIWIILLVRTLLSEALKDWIINGSLFIAVFFFGILLIRSVIREVDLREKIKRAYEVEKKARRQVEELTEAKTQFIMATQHHLRTPLTSMIGYLDLLFGGTYGKAPPKIKETLLKFQVSTKRLIRVVNALLDISQFQMGKKVVALEPGIDFESLIKEVMEELRFEVKVRNLYLKYEKVGQVPAIKADSEKLKVALFNIIDNAIKYTKQGGITLTLKQAGKSVQLLVKDTGIGIEPAQAKKLFKEAFARGEEAKKVHGFGRGIGVYITGHIIRAHNGRIWAESEGKGKGTAFFIELPVG